MRPALFVDKDGTLVENVPYNVDPSQIRFTPGALEGLRRLHAHGFVVVLVTNQAGVALGHFDERALGHLQEALSRKLSAAGISLGGGGDVLVSASSAGGGGTLRAALQLP